MTVGNIYVIASIAVIGGALFGFDISSLSAQLSENSYRCYFNQGPDGPPFNDAEDCSGPRSLTQGAITASMAAGSWLGALVSGVISDRVGRKPAIIAGCWFWLIGSALSCASQNIGMLIAGRTLNGLAVGIESAQAPVYISELSPPSKRGRFVGVQQWAITWGILIMYYISYGCSFIGGRKSSSYSTAQFRVPWGLQMIPAICLNLGMLFLPESPRWLARKDRWEDCEGVLARVHGKGDPNHSLVIHELQNIREICEFERRHKDVTYLDLFRPGMVNRTHVALATQIWSQLTGMNVMMYYITYVFDTAGYSGSSTLLASSIQYIINVVMTMPALLWQDKWGRRPTMLVGAFLMMSLMFANAGIMGGKGTQVPREDRNAPEESMRLSGGPAKAFIACTYLFVASFAPTWGPASWTYPPELFPLRLRGKGVALATSGNWAFNTVLGLFVPPSFENIKWQTYVIFGVFNAAMFIHVFFLFPETAGRTLEETEAIFDDPNGIPYIGIPAWKTSKRTSAMAVMECGDVGLKHGIANTPMQDKHVPELGHTVKVEM